MVRYNHRLNVESQRSLNVGGPNANGKFLQVIQKQNDLDISPNKHGQYQTPQQVSLNLESSKEDDEDYQHLFESETKREESASER